MKRRQLDIDTTEMSNRAKELIHHFNINHAQSNQM